jgi:sugar phosphate isomerase/epimerase
VRLGICHQVSLPGTWEEAIASAGTLGVDGVELFVRGAEAPGLLEDPAAARALGAAAGRAGVVISSLCLTFLMGGTARLADADGAGREQAVAMARKAIERCADAGGGAVLVGGVPAPEEAAAMDAFVRSVRELVPTASGLGLRIGVESGLPADAVLALLERVGEPAVVGDYFDMGNLAGRGMDPAEEVRRRQGRIVQVHAKGVRGAGFDAGTLDLASVGRALREGGFDGWVLLETAAGEDPIGNARRNLARLRESFGL